MTIQTTRRGLLRGTLGATLAAGCKAPSHPGELASATSPEPTAEGRVEVRTVVNGEARSLAVHPDESALECVRGALGLRGSKLACGHGACGACTMSVDGAPRVTCILPATALEGRRVETIEGLSRRDPQGLHPVQRAFMAEDALQCGYCTPGFVTSAAAFHDRWRAEHGAATPPREEVAAALAGHLCRCAAYDAIHRAVARACAGDFDHAPEAPARLDARDKVTGAARYTVDVDLEGVLEARVLRSPVGHGRIRRVDWSRAKALPGVVAILDLREGREVLRYAGQEIVAVAAEDARAAEAAIAAIELDVEALPAIVGLDAGRDPAATPVYKAGKTRRAAPSAMEGPLLPAGWEGNLRGPFTLFSRRKGQARRALAAIVEDPAAGVAVDEVWRTQCQMHSALEPHACVAAWDPAGGLTVFLSTQAVHQIAEDLATRFDLPVEDVRVIAHHVGGGFGAKATLQMEAVIAVELARVARRPVRLVLDRREELTVGGNRPAQEVALGIAASKAGELLGIRATSFADSGVAVGSALGVLFRIMYADAPKDLADWDVVTHAPPGRPLRAPGGPPAFWALEQGVDAIAARLGVDPLTLRRRWDPNPARGRLFTWAEGHAIWKARGAGDRGRLRRGVGLASAGWFYFAAPGTRIQLDAGPDGLVATTATQDIGTGTRTLIATAIAEVFGLPPSAIAVRIGDSRAVPGPMSGGSRVTASVVPAALDAATQARDELVVVASRAFGLSGARAVPGGVAAGGRTIPWAKVLAVAPRISVIGKRTRDRGGYFMPPVEGLATGRYVSGALQLMEVEVDTRLGRVRVLRSATGVSVGKVQTPVLARSQVCGGVIQGISFALYEERRLDPRSGVHLSGNLEDYRIAGIGDVGELEVHFDEGGYENVSGRSVGLGELATLAPAAAIGNAIFDATGWHPRELPLRPDRVLKGVHA